ncbi:MAG: (2Fe-2S)-binding protein [Lachnospiraceae bacterium]|jgi:NAD(P)H-nitrite reductase large subunit
MNLDEVICFCQNVTSGMIKNAVDNGATTLEEVQKITGAGTVCGSCVANVQRLVEQFAAERTDQTE